VHNVLCTRGRSRAHTVVTEEKAKMTQLVVWGGGGRGGEGGVSTGSSQCWSVGHSVHSSLLPTMALFLITYGIGGMGGGLSLNSPIDRRGER
jgi:hypothetical protein